MSGTDGQWPLWEVFVRPRRGLSHQHVGSIHAPDAGIALRNARDVYTRRQEGVSIWVVPSNTITASSPDEKDSFFDPAADKVYRHPTFYDLPEGVEHFMNDAAAYALRLGDDALVLAQRLAEWSSRAPAIEEDVALANIGLDLLGQARAVLTYAGEVEGAGRSEDDLAYLRDERDFTNCLLVEQPNGDFAVTMARQLFFSAYQVQLFDALRRSTDALLAGVAGKAAKEVAYHLDHAASWVARLGDGTAESHRRMAAAVEQLWPFTTELFEADDLTGRLAAAGVAPDPGSLRAGWDATLGSALAAATLERPEATWAPTGGRRGLHTEHLGYLLAEMQHLHRSFPGATW